MKILRWKDILIITGLSQSTISRKIRAGKFPRAFNISDRAVGWISTDVEDWIQSHRQQIVGAEDGANYGA